jgi:hypothetical protein
VLKRDVRRDLFTKRQPGPSDIFGLLSMFLETSGRRVQHRYSSILSKQAPVSVFDSPPGDIENVTPSCCRLLVTSIEPVGNISRAAVFRNLSFGEPWVEGGSQEQKPTRTLDAAGRRRSDIEPAVGSGRYRRIAYRQPGANFAESGRACFRLTTTRKYQRVSCALSATTRDSSSGKLLGAHLSVWNLDTPVQLVFSSQKQVPARARAGRVPCISRSHRRPCFSIPKPAPVIL